MKLTRREFIQGVLLSAGVAVIPAGPATELEPEVARIASEPGDPGIEIVASHKNTPVGNPADFFRPRQVLIVAESHDLGELCKMWIQEEHLISKRIRRELEPMAQTILGIKFYIATRPEQVLSLVVDDIAFAGNVCHDLRELAMSRLRQ